ncbi:hypothetical protein YC2023_109056 [Brassica napus]
MVCEDENWFKGISTHQFLFNSFDLNASNILSLHIVVENIKLIGPRTWRPNNFARISFSD